MQKLCAYTHKLLFATSTLHTACSVCVYATACAYLLVKLNLLLLCNTYTFYVNTGVRASTER
jgi:hypothetical protein